MAIIEPQLTTLPMMCCCSEKNDRLWWGLVAFLLGAIILLQRFDVVPAETWDYLWPSILILSGLKWMLSGDPSGKCSCNSCEEACGDCGSDPCSCEMMPMPKAKKTSKKAKK